jgi:hypothetical protein
VLSRFKSATRKVKWMPANRAGLRAVTGRGLLEISRREAAGVLAGRFAKRATKETSDLPAEPAVAFWAPPERV